MASSEVELSSTPGAAAAVDVDVPTSAAHAPAHVAGGTVPPEMEEVFLTMHYRKMQRDLNGPQKKQSKYHYVALACMLILIYGLSAYQRGEIARTVANYSLDGPAMLVRIGAQAGNYSDSPAARWVDVVVHNVLAPISAKLLFPASGESIMGAVSWDARSLSATVRLGVVEAAKGASVQLLWAASPLSALLCRQDRTVREAPSAPRCLLRLLTVSRRLAQGWPRLNARVMDIKRAIECAHLLRTPVYIYALTAWAAAQLGRLRGGRKGGAIHAPQPAGQHLGAHAGCAGDRG